MKDLRRRHRRCRRHRRRQRRRLLGPQFPPLPSLSPWSPRQQLFDWGKSFLSALVELMVSQQRSSIFGGQISLLNVATPKKCLFRHFFSLTQNLICVGNLFHFGFFSSNKMGSDLAFGLSKTMNF